MASSNLVTNKGLSILGKAIPLPSLMRYQSPGSVSQCHRELCLPLSPWIGVRMPAHGMWAFFLTLLCAATWTRAQMRRYSTKTGVTKLGRWLSTSVYCVKIVFKSLEGPCTSLGVTVFTGL